MEFSQELRREANDIQTDHVRSIGGMRELVKRLMDPSTRAGASAKHDLLLSGFNRRRFLQIGGVSVLSGAILAACGSDDKDDAAAGGTTADGKGTANDRTILRTASSLEHVAIDVYEKAIMSGLVTTAAVGDAAKLFQQQHRDHAALFEGATKEAGGEPFATANPAVLESLGGRIAALKSEMDIIVLARDLEGVAAATYQSTVGAFDNLKLNAAVMSVGGVEARHQAVLNSVLKQNANAVAFGKTDGAVAPGTGVS